MIDLSAVDNGPGALVDNTMQARLLATNSSVCTEEGVELFQGLELVTSTPRSLRVWDGLALLDCEKAAPVTWPVSLKTLHGSRAPTRRPPIFHGSL